MTAPSLPLRVLESTLGLLGATYPTDPWGRLYIRRLQGQVLGGIAKGRSAANMVEISQDTRDHLQFWLQDQFWILPPPPSVTNFTDASLEGWGVVCQEKSFRETLGHQS